MKRHTLVNVVIAASVMLSGCAAQQSVKTPDPADSGLMVESDPALLQLVAVAKAVQSRDAIHDTLITRKYGIEDEAQLPVRDMPTDLRRIISFPGGQQFELHTAITKLAQEGGITYLAPQGYKPLSGIYVFFDDQIRTVGEYIADAGRQAGFRADVVLDLSAKPKPTVQVQYKEPRL